MDGPGQLEELRESQGVGGIRSDSLSSPDRSESICGGIGWGCSHLANSRTGGDQSREETNLKFPATFKKSNAIAHQLEVFFSLWIKRNIVLRPGTGQNQSRKEDVLKEEVEDFGEESFCTRTLPPLTHSPQPAID